MFLGFFRKTDVMEIKLISLIWGQDKINVSHVKVKLLQFYKHC